MNWGVEVHQHPVVQSDTRQVMVDELAEYLNEVGIKRSLQIKAQMIAEELLMNAIYDAPHDASGKALYNHLSRTKKIILKPEEQGEFRYACDGMLIAISVTDPFGALDRKIIIDYLESCYTGKAGSINEALGKGGAGHPS